ncbi:hypothetical protein L6452_27876 [Arctium lappa]|uniref:Uncharacterized protein n=1 Tax=Arctium lappa TaxID=4217 RepID=A0ACB8ZXP7_ARCLA|nr:hypothetical protein L6452_27876 [Arctium lappa]
MYTQSQLVLSNKQRGKTDTRCCRGNSGVSSSEVVDESQKTIETESKEQTVFTDSTNISLDPNSAQNEFNKHTEGIDSTNNESSSDSNSAEVNSSQTESKEQTGDTNSTNNEPRSDSDSTQNESTQKECR